MPNAIKVRKRKDPEGFPPEACSIIAELEKFLAPAKIRHTGIAYQAYRASWSRIALGNTELAMLWDMAEEHGLTSMSVTRNRSGLASVRVSIFRPRDQS